jgi:hypothetical protein
MTKYYNYADLKNELAKELGISLNNIDSRLADSSDVSLFQDIFGLHESKFTQLAISVLYKNFIDNLTETYFPPPSYLNPHPSGKDSVNIKILNPRQPDQVAQICLPNYIEDDSDQ